MLACKPKRQSPIRHKGELFTIRIVHSVELLQPIGLFAYIFRQFGHIDRFDVNDLAIRWSGVKSVLHMRYPFLMLMVCTTVCGLARLRST